MDMWRAPDYTHLYQRRRPLLIPSLQRQFARPDADVTDGSWTNQAGSNVNLYQSVDEVSPDDADYIQSSEAPSSDTCEISLETLTDPVTSSGHIVRYRYRKSGGATINLTVSLRQGASTEIAAWTHNGIGTDWLNAEQTLSGGQADAISDYSDLRMRFVATQV